MPTLCCWLICCALGDAPSLDELVRRHREGLALIQTVDAKVEVDTSADGGKTWRPMAKTIWRRDAKRERFIEHIFFYYDPAGLLRNEENWSDYAWGPDQSMDLLGWDLDAPPEVPLSPSDHYSGALGTIKPPAKPVGGGRVYFWLLLTPSVRNLDELARVATRKEVLGTVDVDGESLWGIEMDDPRGNLTYKVYLDPKHNYLVKRVATNSASAGSPPERYTSVFDVQEFQEAKPGVWVPTEVLGTTHQEGRKEPTSMLRARATWLKVNEPIAASDLKIDFPEGLMVNDRVARKIHIWGKGKPELTFSNEVELMVWEKWMALGVFGRDFLLISAVLASIVVGLWGLRWTLKRRAARSAGG